MCVSVCVRARDRECLRARALLRMSLGWEVARGYLDGAGPLRAVEVLDRALPFLGADVARDRDKSRRRCTFPATAAVRCRHTVFS